MTERKQISLFARTVLMVVSGVVLTFFVYLIIRWGGSRAIDFFYMSHDAVSARNSRLAEALQQYVTEHDVSSSDYETLEQWAVETGDVDFIIYEENGIYEAGTWGYEFITDESADTHDLSRWGYTSFTTEFSNGARSVAIADCSDLGLQDTVQTLATVLSFFTFVGTIMIYTRRISRYLQALSADVTAVSSGEAERVNELRGITELNALAQDVNRMHVVVTDRTRSAQDALRANRELITALSHDIRNPLTSLIGYLDLLEMESGAFTETQRHYLDASTEKADRIRILTDEMFRYFLIFSDEKPPVRTEAFDAQILLEQMLGEHAIELESQGYTIESDALQTPCRIYADIEMMHRVLENLFSNIKKYADPAQPVCLAAHVEGERLHVLVSNGVQDPPPHNVESNRVGLKTCAAILELLHGSFSAGEENGRFLAEFTLPLSGDGNEA